MADTPEEEFIYEDRSQLRAIIPISPLPNVVLIPNASLPLFILKSATSRWSAIVCKAIAISLSPCSKKAGSKTGPPRPHPIAGFGRIIRATRLPNDCMDIVVQGMGRLRR